MHHRIHFGKTLAVWLLTLAMLTMMASGFGLSASAVGLKAGTAEKWIDRLDLNGADWAREFYDKLVNASRTDPVYAAGSWLVKPETAAYTKTLSDGSIVVVLKENNGTAGFTCGEPENEEAVEQAASEKLSEVLTEKLADVSAYASAVYDAFDRDHPEVFWLSGERQCGEQISSSITCDPNGNGNVDYTQTFYFVLKSADFDVREATTVAKLSELVHIRDYRVNDYIEQATGSVYEKVKYLNNLLTKGNCYNSDLSTADPLAWESTSALLGEEDTKAPVCEGYARAFKLLCDKLGIPCVLVSGIAKNSAASAGEAHMWNLVQIDNAWYAVDVTWNDPVVAGVTSAVSGYENENYLLVGADTVINGMKFAESHIVQNTASTGGVAFTNGPTLASDAYSAAAYTITVNADANGTITLPAKAEADVKVTPAIKPNVGYMLESITVMQGETPVETAADNSFTMPAGNVTVTVKFAKCTHADCVSGECACGVTKLTTATVKGNPFVSGWVTETTLNGTVPVLGTANTGKTAWAAGDALLVSLDSASYGAQTAVLTYNGSAWIFSFPEGVDGLYCVTGETPSFTAVYAPGAAKPGTEESLRGSCILREGKLTISLGSNRPYSRLRIAGAANTAYSVTVNGFTPAGMTEAGTHTYTLTTDNAGNAFLYGRFDKNGAVAVGSVSCTFTESSSAGVSYALCAAHTAAEGAEATCLGELCTRCGGHFGEADAANHAGFDPTTGKCTCGAMLAEAALKVGSTTTYYPTLDAALTAAKSCGSTSAEGAVLTLLKNAAGTLSLAGNFTLDLNEKTLTGSLTADSASAVVIKNGKWEMASNAPLITVSHTGAVVTLNCIALPDEMAESALYAVVDAGSLTINTCIIKGVVRVADGAGLTMGGVTGDRAALVLKENSFVTVSAALNGKFDVSKTNAANANCTGVVAKPGAGVTLNPANFTAATMKGFLIAADTGELVLKVCDHAGSTDTDAHEATHTFTCALCRLTVTAEAHIYNTHDVCAVCGHEAAAKVDTTAYATLEEALALRRGPVQLLRDYTLIGDAEIAADLVLNTHTLTVADGKRLTLGAKLAQGKVNGSVNGGLVVINSSAELAEVAVTNADGYAVSAAGNVMIGAGVALSGCPAEIYLENLDAVLVFTAANEAMLGDVPYTVAYAAGLNPGGHLLAVQSADGLVPRAEWLVLPEGYAAVAVTEHALAALKTARILTADMVTVSGEFSYDTTAHTPTVVVMDGGTTLIASIDYILSCTNNINAGTAYVTITGMGSYTGTVQKSFTIAQGVPTYTVPTGLTAIYGQTLADILLPNGFSWEQAQTTAVGAVGQNTLSATYTPGDANYKIMTGIPVTITVTAAPSGLTKAPAAVGGLVYSGSAQTLILAGEAVDGKLVYSLNQDGPYTEAIPTGTAAGNYVVWYYIQGDDNHSNSEKAAVTASIGQLAVTPVVTGSVTKLYDGTNAVPAEHRLTISLTGKLDGDEVEASASTYVYDGVKVGTTAIQAGGITLTGKDSGNYKLSSSTASGNVGTITPIDVTDLVAPSAKADLVYTGQAQTLIQGGSAVGGIMQYSLDGQTWSTAMPTGIAAGSYTVQYKVVGDENHKDSAAASVEVTIAKADAPVITPVEKQYVHTLATNGNVVDIAALLPADRGETSYRYTVSDSSAVLNLPADAVNDDGRLTFATLAAPTTATASITVTAAMANYADTAITVQIRLVDKTPVNITGVSAAAGLIYTGAAQQGYTGAPASAYTGSYTITYTGRGDTSYSSASAPVHAGDYTVIFRVPDTDPIYTGSLSVDFSIAKAVITVTAMDQRASVSSSVPDLSSPVLGTHYTVSGLRGSDTLSGTIVLAYQQAGLPVMPNTAQIGEYTIIVSGAAQTSGNYSITYIPGKLTVVQAGTTFDGGVTADKTVYTYGETITVTAKLVPVASYSLRAAAPAARQMALYWGETQISAAVDADENGIYIMTCYTADKLLPVGVNTITARFVGDENLADHAQNITILLNPKPLTITGASAADRAYDRTRMVAITAVTLEGLLSGDAAEADLADLTGALTGADVGIYHTVTLSAMGLTGADSQYYTLSLPAEAALSKAVQITAKPVQAQVILAQTSYVRDGQAKTPAVTVMDGDVLIPADEYSVSYTNNTEAGTATVTVTDKPGGSYTVSGKAYFQIIAATSSPALRTVTFDANGGSYAPAPQTAILGSLIREPAAAVREDHRLVGWSTDRTGGKLWDFAADTLTDNITLYAQWERVMFDVTGTVRTHDNQVPGHAIAIMVKQGSVVFIETETDENGLYTLQHVPAGAYNIEAVEANGSGRTMTAMVRVDTNMHVDPIYLPENNVSSHLEIPADGRTPAIVVGGLDEEAEHNAAQAPAGHQPHVALSMHVQQKPTSAVDSAQTAIKNQAASTGAAETDRVFAFLAIQLEKTTAGQPGVTVIDETQRLLEIIVPFDTEGRTNFRIYRQHGERVQELYLKANPDGECFAVGDGYIVIFARKFSTYAISSTEKKQNVPVTPVPGVTSMTIPQTAVSAVPGAHIQLTALADGLPLSSADVLWRVQGGADPSTGIDQNGMLTIGGRETAETLLIMAQYKLNPAVFTTTTITVERKPASEPDYWFWVLLNLYNKELLLTAEAGEGGAITPAGASLVKYKKSVTYTITPDAGYQIADVLVDGKSVGAVTEYTFEKVRKGHTIQAIFAPIPWENPFADVSEQDWFCVDVRYVYENGLMDAADGTETFLPEAPMTRAMLVTSLWQMAGRPDVDGYVDLLDVPEGAEYRAAMEWAAVQGIVLSDENGLFAPDAGMTRAEMAQMIYRYVRSLGGGFRGMWMFLLRYDDAAEVPEEAYEAICWLTMNQIYPLEADGMLAPGKTATRADAAAFLHRFGEYQAEQMN